MIDTRMCNESVDTATLNAISDKCDTVSVTHCEIKGAFFSNINSWICLVGNYAIDTVFVLRNNDASRVDGNICKGIRPVSVVSGYAYTHQITRSPRYGA